MRKNIDILGVFHDGSIVEIMGSLPELTFRVEIEYLRNMFPSDGDSFLLQFSGCKHIEFLDWETEIRTKDLKEIQDKDLEILSVEQREDIAHIICSTGELDILYKDVGFKIDSGEEISDQELMDAGTKYWDDWSKKSKS